MVTPAPSVFLCIGDNGYLREKAVKGLVASHLGNSSKDLDCKVFYGGESEAGEVADQINTSPFLASKRVVIIKNLEQASDELKECLSRYIKKPLQSTCLILESADDSLLKEYPEVAGSVEVRRFGRMSDRELASWVKRFFDERGKEIDDEAISILASSYGHDILSLTQELEKVSAFTGEKRRVDSDDVEAVVGRNLVASTFDLADAIGLRRTAAALRICHDLTTAGSKEYEIIGLLCWHFKRMLRAKALQSRGESDYRVSAILRIAQRHSAGFFRQVAGFSARELRSRIETLLEADLDIKRTRFDQTLVLEFAIIKLSLR